MEQAANVGTKDEQEEYKDNIPEAKTETDTEVEEPNTTAESEVQEEALAQEDANEIIEQSSSELMLEPTSKSDVTKEAPGQDNKETKEESEPTSTIVTSEPSDVDLGQDETPETEKDNEITIVEVEHEKIDRGHAESEQSAVKPDEPSQNDSTDENEPSFDVPTLVKRFESSFTEPNQQGMSPKKESNDTQATTWVFESEGVDGENEQEEVIGDSTEHLMSEGGNDNISTEPDEMKLDLGKEHHDESFNGKAEKVEPAEVTDSHTVGIS